MQHRDQGTADLLRADWRRLMALSGTPDRPLRLRDRLHPRFAHVVLIRSALDAAARGRLGSARLRALLLYLLFRIEVNASCRIGPGLVLPHPGGMVLGAARIGSDVTIFQNVTLGARALDIAGTAAMRPSIGDGVVIGAGAVVAGPVRVGRGATVAANSLVTRDVPEGATAIGVPASLRMRTPAFPGMQGRGRVAEVAR